MKKQTHPIENEPTGRIHEDAPWDEDEHGNQETWKEYLDKVFGESD